MHYEPFIKQFLVVKVATDVHEPLQLLKGAIFKNWLLVKFILKTNIT